jgi:hypothetical protein
VSRSPLFVLGLDLGQARDYTAISISARTEQDRKGIYALRHLERCRLGTPYPAIVRRVKHLDRMIREAPHWGDCRVAVDATGVGRPVVDLLEEAKIPSIYPVTITGGDEAHQDGRSFRVPKRELVSGLQVLLQTERLKIAQDIPHAETFVAELRNFRVRISESGHDSYEAWREGSHDDLVLSVAIACWLGERVSVPRNLGGTPSWMR